MITKEDKFAIVDLASRYHAKRVLLFGSSIDPDRTAGDIDPKNIVRIQSYAIGSVKLRFYVALSGLKSV